MADKTDKNPASGNDHTIYFEFIKNRWYLYAVSIMILVGTPLCLATRGLNWGMDFRGGTEFLVQINTASIEEELVRNTVEKPEFKSELGETQVFKVSNASSRPNEATFSIRTAMQPDQIRGMPERIAKALSDPAAKRTCAVVSVNSVGPVVGDSLKKNTLKAIFWSAVVIMIYMSIQFEFRPGLLATIALVHDSLTVVLLFSLTHYEVDLTAVAALLTVLGYSMNDSIVILDRVRENQRLKRKMPFDELVNLSINQCLGRTIYVGLTVILTLLTLLFMGPMVLRSFSLAMVVGVISGMTSTLSIVCPVLVDWTLWEKGARESDSKK